MLKDDRNGGRKDRKVESEKRFAEGRTVETQEEHNEHKRVKRPNSNQIFINNCFSSLTIFHFIEMKKKEVMPMRSIFGSPSEEASVANFLCCSRDVR